MPINKWIACAQLAMRLLFAHEMKCSAVEVKEREPKEGKEREKKLQFNTSSASVQWIELSGRKI